MENAKENRKRIKLALELNFFTTTKNQRSLEFFFIIYLPDGCIIETHAWHHPSLCTYQCHMHPWSQRVHRHWMNRQLSVRIFPSRFLDSRSKSVAANSDHRLYVQPRRLRRNPAFEQRTHRDSLNACRPWFSPATDLSARTLACIKVATNPCSNFATMACRDGRWERSAGAMVGPISAVLPLPCCLCAPTCFGALRWGLPRIRPLSRCSPRSPGPLFDQLSLFSSDVTDSPVGSLLVAGARAMLCASSAEDSTTFTTAVAQIETLAVVGYPGALGLCVCPLWTQITGWAINA